MTTKYKVGDWVRFYSNGKLVIGVVEYIRPHQFFPNSLPYELYTDKGTVAIDSVIEHRSIKEKNVST